ncbi:hypothetical protein EVAR_38194_1 [Eumeta japonica]|uniref:Uncharacterized protein n=1 Tax=Eumeta variegata TaxID=151549 RepID=A0A4C1WDF1_EUMVA|nr:hypothetical protein EVAR_38194_1 [Eumeta japonica]
MRDNGTTNGTAPHVTYIGRARPRAGVVSAFSLIFAAGVNDHNRTGEVSGVAFEPGSAGFDPDHGWFNKFKRVRTNLTDDLHEESLVKVTSEDNFGIVRLVIETDKRSTYQQSRTTLGIGMSQVNNILREYLAVGKLCTRYGRRTLNSLLPSRNQKAVCPSVGVPSAKGQARRRYVVRVALSNRVLAARENIIFHRAGGDGEGWSVGEGAGHEAEMSFLRLTGTRERKFNGPRGELINSPSRLSVGLSSD